MAYNMKGNPFQRNFGIGISPLKSNTETRPLTESEKTKLKGNMGSAPNPAKTAMSIYKGVKSIYNKLTN